MRDLSAQARRALQLHDAGVVGHEECRALAGEMQQFMVETTTGLLDLADRAEAIGDRRCAEDLYGAAMEIENELLQARRRPSRWRAAPHPSRRSQAGDATGDHHDPLAADARRAGVPGADAAAAAG